MDTYACLCAHTCTRLQPPLRTPRRTPRRLPRGGPSPRPGCGSARPQGLAPITSEALGRAPPPGCPGLRGASQNQTDTRPAGPAAAGPPGAPSARSPHHGAHPQPPAVGQGSPTPTSLTDQARPALGTCQGPGPYPLRMPWTWGQSQVRAPGRRPGAGDCVP